MKTRKLSKLEVAITESLVSPEEKFAQHQPGHRSAELKLINGSENCEAMVSFGRV